MPRDIVRKESVTGLVLRNVKERNKQYLSLSCFLG